MDPPRYRRCPECDRYYPPIRMGARLTKTELMVFDLVKNSGVDGVISNDLRCYIEDIRRQKSAKNVLKVHVANINRKIENSGFRIISSYPISNGYGKGPTWMYVLVKFERGQSVSLLRRSLYRGLPGETPRNPFRFGQPKRNVFHLRRGSGSATAAPLGPDSRPMLPDTKEQGVTSSLTEERKMSRQG